MRPAGEYKPRGMEEGILKFWKEKGIPERTLTDGKKRFSFLEGPPTPNAPPALHHVEVRAFKDLVNRFKFMQGFSVPRKAGWDCHGLPVEVQIEKKLKLNSKKEIVSYGIDRFVEECRKSVFSNIEDWNKLTERMAYWIDMENPYVTMRNEYIESVWWSLKEIWKKGLLYLDHKVVPYCPRCGTPLSSHEVALGYQEIKEETVIVRFQAKDKDFYFLAWTTTPWTLLSNLALAVNPKLEYAKIRYKGENYVLAKELAEKRFPDSEVLETFMGSELLGIEYQPLFSHFVGKLDKKAWFVIGGDFVTIEEGTGIVHIAPAFGEDDFNAGKKNNLPLVNPISEDGKFTEQIPELKGMFAKDADSRIVSILEEQDALIAKYPYKHDYPFCWRCSSPLLYYAMKSWFIAMEKLKKNLISNNNRVKWFPEHMKSGRFGDWLENVKDWSLSRNRFWGTPLPIWICECGNKEVIGSRKELTEKSASKIDANIDLHRPYVDKVKLKCRCGKLMSRVDYVIDCWYDSGAATFAQYHYPFENKELFERSFPYDFICEATDQTRGWFYTLLAISTVIFNKPAYKSVVVGGLLLDDKGEKMSSSKDNIIHPWDLFNTVGADAVRLQMFATAPWNAKRFGKETLDETAIPMLRTLWSCYEFTTRYMLLDRFEPSKHQLGDAKLRIEDEWILSAVDALAENVNRNLENNDYHHLVANMNNFVTEDLSRGYIKLIRDRLWLEDKGSKMDESKFAAYVTLSEVFRRLCTILAPAAPFIAEEIYQNLVKGREESVHFLKWPKPEHINPELGFQMNLAKKIFEAGSNCRQNAGIKLRHPIKSVTVVGDSKVRKTVDTLGEVIKKQLNAKDVKFVDEIPGTKYIGVPNFKILGPKFGKDAVRVAELIRENGKKLRERKKINLDGYEITPEMVSDVRVETPEGYISAAFALENTSGIVYIDAERDPSLLHEALARDVIRNVQELRKKSNLEELERIHVFITDTAMVREMLKGFERVVLDEVRADKIVLEKSVKGAEFEFDEETISVGIKTGF